MLAILFLYDGKNIYEAEIIRRSERTIKEWLKRWNERGYEGILPETSKRGRKPKISSEEGDKMKEIEGKEMTIKEVTVYVKTTRGIEYAYKTWTILRMKKKVKYGKPFVQNEKRPENAEEISKKERMIAYQMLRIVL